MEIHCERNHCSPINTAVWKGMGILLYSGVFVKALQQKQVKNNQVSKYTGCKTSGKTLWNA